MGLSDRDVGFCDENQCLQNHIMVIVVQNYPLFIGITGHACVFLLRIISADIKSSQWELWRLCKKSRQSGWAVQFSAQSDQAQNAQAQQAERTWLGNLGDVFVIKVDVGKAATLRLIKA